MHCLVAVARARENGHALQQGQVALHRVLSDGGAQHGLECGLDARGGDVGGGLLKEVVRVAVGLLARPAGHRRHAHGARRALHRAHPRTVATHGVTDKEQPVAVHRHARRHQRGQHCCHRIDRRQRCALTTLLPVVRAMPRWCHHPEPIDAEDEAFVGRRELTLVGVG